jgi:hypothetical protein
MYAHWQLRIYIQRYRLYSFVYSFRQQCKICYTTAAKYMANHLPLKNSFLRNLASLDPEEHGKEITAVRFRRLIQYICPRVLTTTEANTAVNQFGVYRYANFATLYE